jgi:signal transduction histidine kinase
MGRVPPRDVRGGLARRTIFASAALAILVGAAFAVLVRAITEERDSARLATHSQAVLATANALEELVIDLETGQRGFLITHEQRFLEPWDTARAAYTSVSRDLNALAVVPAQDRRARQITQAVESYARDYSVPLVNAARRHEASARSPATLDEGKRRVDVLRRQFAGLVGAERSLFAERQRRSDTDARRAIMAATAGVAGSVLLVVVFGGYLTRAIVLPLRRAANMAGRLAAGDLTTRMPETGVGEIGDVERAFNAMGRDLETGRDELRQLADEQAALRRVATLVARRVPSSELLDSVATEAGRLLGADVTRLLRFEPDGTVTAVGRQSESGAHVFDDAHHTPEDGTVAGLVLRTGRAARIDADESSRSSVGAPIVVGGRLWGVMVADWTRDTAGAADTEARMTQFTELVATAIADTESRAELAASRARVVATADETRRRIERDLHDGAQQRLVHAVITLKLAQRSLGPARGDAADLVGEALEHTQGANADLRELVHGILPAALRRGGLRAGIEAVVSRLALTVSLDVPDERFPPALEATAYFIAAEALTNAVKHARASSAEVTAVVEAGALHVEVRDDGVGGAQLDGSSGLLGLHDRAAALGGELRVESPEGGGTVVAATLPIPDAHD